MIKYYRYKSDKPNLKHGRVSASDLIIHKDEARKQRYINRQKIMKIGLNQVFILPFDGVNGCCVIYQQITARYIDIKN